MCCALTFYGWVNRCIAKSSVHLPYSYNIILYCLSENAEGKYISPFHDIPMYADEGQVTSFQRNQNKCACVWTSLHHIKQLNSIATSESISISVTVERHHLHWHTAAAWSAIGLHYYISSVTNIFSTAFGGNAEIIVWFLNPPIAMLKVSVLVCCVAIKQGMWVEDRQPKWQSVRSGPGRHAQSMQICNSNYHKSVILPKYFECIFWR